MGPDETPPARKILRLAGRSLASQEEETKRDCIFDGGTMLVRVKVGPGVRFFETCCQTHSHFRFDRSFKVARYELEKLIGMLVFRIYTDEKELELKNKPVFATFKLCKKESGGKTLYYVVLSLMPEVPTKLELKVFSTAKEIGDADTVYRQPIGDGLLAVVKRK